ncbi:MAG: hypothetical protein D4S02_01295 [Rhodocyclaceae bacterium]|nr:MAG: hypothetical protein D4S02_01295 [Rhodocyclaceae bacterium]
MTRQKYLDRGDFDGPAGWPPTGKAQARLLRQELARRFQAHARAVFILLDDRDSQSIASISDGGYRVDRGSKSNGREVGLPSIGECVASFVGISIFRSETRASAVLEARFTAPSLAGES